MKLDIASLTHAADRSGEETSLHCAVLPLSIQRVQGKPARLALHLTFLSWHGTQALLFFTVLCSGQSEPAMFVDKVVLKARRKLMKTKSGWASISNPIFAFCSRSRSVCGRPVPEPCETLGKRTTSDTLTETSPPGSSSFELHNLPWPRNYFCAEQYRRGDGWTM